MTIHITTHTTIEVPQDRPVVQISNTREVWLWPKGVGEGPTILFSNDTWDDIVVRVNEARKATTP